MPTSTNPNVAINNNKDPILLDFVCSLIIYAKLIFDNIKPCNIYPFFISPTGLLSFKILWIKSISPSVRRSLPSNNLVDILKYSPIYIGDSYSLSNNNSLIDILDIGYVKKYTFFDYSRISNNYKSMTNNVSIKNVSLEEISKLNRTCGKYEGLLVDRQGYFSIKNIKKYVVR